MDMPKFDIQAHKPKIPELVAKKISAPHTHSLKKDFTCFDNIKKKAKKCLRCGELILTGVNQHFCPTCRGGEMGINDYVRFKENWNSGTVVTGIVEDMRR